MAEILYMAQMEFLHVCTTLEETYAFRHNALYTFTATAYHSICFHEPPYASVSMCHGYGWA